MHRRIGRATALVVAGAAWLAPAAQAEDWVAVGVEHGLAAAIDRESINLNRVTDSMSVVLRLAGDFRAMLESAEPGAAASIPPGAFDLSAIDARFSYSCRTGRMTGVTFLGAYDAERTPVGVPNAFIVNFVESAMASAEEEATPGTLARTRASCEQLKQSLP